VREVEWTEAALEDMAALDKGIARRTKRAVERFANTAAGDLKKLQGVRPPEFRLRVGDYRVRFRLDADTVSILRSPSPRGVSVRE
jgi:mRNA-degrading endonuclease RelE of RelBE toxin-antitoxin system